MACGHPIKPYGEVHMARTCMCTVCKSSIPVSPEDGSRLGSRPSSPSDLQMTAAVGTACQQPQKRPRARTTQLSCSAFLTHRNCQITKMFIQATEFWGNLLYLINQYPHQEREHLSVDFFLLPHWVLLSSLNLWIDFEKFSHSKNYVTSIPFLPASELILINVFYFQDF